MMVSRALSPHLHFLFFEYSPTSFFSYNMCTIATVDHLRFLPTPNGSFPFNVTGRQNTQFSLMIPLDEFSLADHSFGYGQVEFSPGFTF